jgi:hypothetical protein
MAGEPNPLPRDYHEVVSPSELPEDLLAVNLCVATFETTKDDGCGDCFRLTWLGSSTAWLDPKSLACKHVRKLMANTYQRLTTESQADGTITLNFSGAMDRKQVLTNLNLNRIHEVKMDEDGELRFDSRQMGARSYVTKPMICAA